MRLLIIARNRRVGVEGDRIVDPSGAFDLVLVFPDADVRPGLINAHDHLHRNHYGRLGQPPYRNACQWAHDIQASCRVRIDAARRSPRRESLLVGAWKNLFAGVTSVVHHDAWEPDFDDDFPLRVVRVRNADSIGMTPALGGWRGEGRFCLHLAEGVDPGAAEEVRTLAARGLLTADLMAVHAVGVDDDAIARFRAAGAAVVWCPSSNLFLFGDTAPAALLEEGVDVLVGSDSRLTGAGDLLDELRCARGLGLISQDRLEREVSDVAARRLGLAPPSLEPGAAADLVILSRPLTEASAQDVELVIVGGEVRVARPDLGPDLDRFIPGGGERRVGSVTRWTSAGSVIPSFERSHP